MAGSAVSGPTEPGVRRHATGFSRHSHHGAGNDPVHVGACSAASQKCGPVRWSAFGHQAEYHAFSMQ